MLADLHLGVLPINSLDQFDHARLVGDIEMLVVQKALPIEATAAFADEHGVRKVHLVESSLRDGISLAALSQARTLSELDLGTGLPGALTLPGASIVHVGWGRGHRRAAYSLPPLPGLKTLSLSAMPNDWAAHTAGWTSLTHLGLYHRAAEAMGELRDLPALTHLNVASERDYSLPSTLAHPGVTHLLLILTEAPRDVDLTHLPTAFPALTELALVSRTDSRQTIDLAPLTRMPHLRIRLSGFARGDGRIHGAEAFTKDQLRWE